MAVSTNTDIDYGVIFGPVNVESSALNPTSLIGLMTGDGRTEKDDINLSLDPFEMSKRTHALEWLICIPSARNEEEQNMEAYSKGGKVYYRTLRIIKAGEPLFVWYSKDFCQALQIQIIKRHSDQDGEQLVCNFCGEVFQHEFPLMAHHTFKCEEIVSSNFRETEKKIKNELNLLKSKLHNIINEIILEKNAKSSKNLAKSLKRDFECVDIAQVNTPDNVRRLSSDTVLNTYSDASAFRKVENDNRSFYTPHSTLSNFSGKRYKVSEPSSDVDLCLYGFNFSCVQTSPQTSVMPKVCQSNTVQLPHPPMSQQVSQNGSVKASMIFSLSDQWKQYFMSERPNAGIPYMKSSNPMVEKILQNTSPVAVKSPVNAMVLSQNWCAKCNTSFRMTSDLVYHMRSHHKREFDPVKKKRDDKLRCNICQETFRERHHLTRHMTSHV
ncbi:uncharacterized protein LOC133178351 [Saccostrea echinata]|uniref:uncharacterized protein LOC133178351 n=1 Tax=Saccostrea echinata TaxID=191078 RepID=UPI002A83E51D|nr:uncharacterized protein LOC133178351 [Saccostrea echinata]